jgi:hypothetical protein
MLLDEINDPSRTNDDAVEFLVEALQREAMQEYQLLDENVKLVAYRVAKLWEHSGRKPDNIDDGFWENERDDFDYRQACTGVQPCGTKSFLFGWDGRNPLKENGCFCVPNLANTSSDAIGGVNFSGRCLGIHSVTLAYCESAFSQSSLIMLNRFIR